MQCVYKFDFAGDPNYQVVWRGEFDDKVTPYCDIKDVYALVSRNNERLLVNEPLLLIIT